MLAGRSLQINTCVVRERLIKITEDVLKLVVFIHDHEGEKNQPLIKVNFSAIECLGTFRARGGRETTPAQAASGKFMSLTNRLKKRKLPVPR
jgi:hypothetical protein